MDAASRSFALAFSTLLATAGCLASSAPTGPESPAGTLAPADASPSPGTPQGPAPSPPSPTPIPPVFRQFGCQSFYSHHTVPEEYALRHLPTGFEPYVPPGSDGALFSSKLWRCESALLGNASVDATSFLLYYLATVPPEPFQDPNVTFYWYPLEVISDTQTGADIFRSWTIRSAVDGDIEFRHLESGPAPSASGTGQSPNTTADLTAIITLPSNGPAGLVRYFGDGEGGVTAAVDIIVHEGLRGTGPASLLRLDGPKSPWTTWDMGRPEYQGWAATALSYTWTYVGFGTGS